MGKRRAPAPVILVGSSFVPHAGIIHDVWSRALDRIGPNSVIVAPAGNQGDQETEVHASTLHFPAALHLTHPDRVIGVASLDNSAAHNASDFTNSGPWVTCSAIGEGVRSTFLFVNMPVEENPNQPDHNFRGTPTTGRAWAAWNGTSFSAPKVAAAIAAALPVANPNAAQLAAAVAAVLHSGPSGNVADPNLGFILSNL